MEQISLRNNHWILRSDQVAGSCHDNDPEQCQDYIFTLSDPDRITMVLCDGAGFSAYGKVAAQTASETIAVTFHEDFDYYRNLPIPNMKRKLTYILQRALLQKAEEMDIDPKLLATTILAVSLDSQGNILTMHLGDGRILWKTRADPIMKDFSLPQQGIRKHSTYLTMNCPIFHYMRIYRWTQPDTQQILLLSDGMDSLGDTKDPSLFLCENQEMLHRNMQNCHSFDDMSYILCEVQYPK